MSSDCCIYFPDGRRSERDTERDTEKRHREETQRETQRETHVDESSIWAGPLFSGWRESSAHLVNKVVSTAASQRQGPGFHSRLGSLSVWSLHVLPVSAWVFFGCSGFLPPFKKDVQVRVDWPLSVQRCAGWVDWPC